ncbi:ATP-binding protein [soil metagenome]
MFNHSRRNLARWFTLSMGSILILFAGTTYYLRTEDRLEATDRLLYKKTRIMAASVQYDLSEGKPQVDLGNVPLLGSGLRPLGTDLVYVRWYDSKKQLKRFFGTPPADPLMIPSGFRTVKTRESLSTEKIWLRQVTLPVQEGNELIGYLQVAIPLGDIQADLRQFQLALTLSVLVTLVLIGFIGWYLGGIAMQPIRAAYMQLQRFTADASHELRSPLSASLTNAQVAQLLAADYPEIQPSLENIIDSTQSMNVLVNNLLMLARHQGRLAPDLLKPINLNIFLSELAADYVALAAAQKIKFIVHVPEQHIKVLGDPDLLKQAVKNLLSNAYKYTAVGGTVWLRLETHSSWAIVQVVDTGIGISEKDLPYVFDRFYRVDTQRTRDKGGFGLGLSLAQQVVQAHGGQIRVTSVDHKGSTFQIQLALLHK